MLVEALDCFWSVLFRVRLDCLPTFFRAQQPDRFSRSSIASRTKAARPIPDLWFMFTRNVDSIVPILLDTDQKVNYMRLDKHLFTG